MGLLVNVQQINYSITIKSNRSTSHTNRVGYFPGYGWVWFNPNSIMDIITIKNMEQHNRVMYYSAA